MRRGVKIQKFKDSRIQSQIFDLRWLLQNLPFGKSKLLLGFLKFEI